MSQTERLCRIKHMVDHDGCAVRERLLSELRVSSATVKRDIAYLRDRMNVPLQWDKDRRGWRLDIGTRSVGIQYELPGLWMNAEEIHALLTMQHLLSNLDGGGLLAPHIGPLAERLVRMLGSASNASAEIGRRIRIQTVGARRVHVPHFQLVESALLRRKRLEIVYHGRGRDLRAARTVSPQRLNHYRDNWYLDAWCHRARGLRSFSVDAIQEARVLDRVAIDVSNAELDSVLGAGYGIFAGRRVAWARLRFTAERARWVATETWHPKQRGAFDRKGRYELTLPYADARELAMDILRHVPEVEVLGPRTLRKLIEAKVRATVDRMSAQDHSVTP